MMGYGDGMGFMGGGMLLWILLILGIGVLIGWAISKRR